ncbi:MAG: BREX-3 system P-loop-containing protein BrxF [Clostridia bacterium]|nr:BREX-3 system P-loop-containing protein BrxF [Clostridia bacterium]
MYLLKSSELTPEFLNLKQSGVPLVFCSESPRICKRVESAGYIELKINIILSERLCRIPRDERAKLVEFKLNNLLNYYHAPVLISDFEMLFDPRYKIDILRFFCEKARIINVAIKWPGQYADGKLTYANPADPDYHEFDCNAYQIRIVQ